MNEEVFRKLIDAGVGCCIAPQLQRSGGGIRIRQESTQRSLWDIAPNMFRPGYPEHFEQRVSLLPVIANFLFRSSTTMSPRTAAGSGPSHRKSIYEKEVEIEFRDDLRHHLWSTLANGLRDCQPARELPFPRVSPKANVDGKNNGHSQYSVGAEEVFRCLESGNGFDISNSRQYLKSVSGVDSSCDMDVFLVDEQEEPQWGFLSNHMCSNDSKHVQVGQVDSISVLHDHGISGEGRKLKEEFEAFEANESTDLLGEARLHSDHTSRDSDVSMLMIPSSDTNEHIGKGDVNEGQDWIGWWAGLSHEISRMHPLTQRTSDNHVMKAESDEKLGTPLNARSARNVANEDESLATDDKCFAEPQKICRQRSRSEFWFGETASVSEIELIWSSQETTYEDLSDEESILEDLDSMAASKPHQKSEASLSDVLGNEHLMWKMWQRRGSVAPRGEEDINDMRMLYESDPDMKFFGPGWDLSPSDVSSSSNEDPMLHQVVPRRSPSTQSTPSPTRSSYVGTKRPTSSSSTGKQNTDGKHQRRSSLIKRFHWGGRQNTGDLTNLDENKVSNREVEVKRRRTMDDYDTMDKDEPIDESNEMLFR